MKIKRLTILIKKYLPDALFVSAFFYVVFNPDRLGTWVGTLLKNINLIMDKTN